MTVLLGAVREWYCPNCKQTASKPLLPASIPHVEMHPCPKLGILAPMVAKGTRAKVTKHEREDYVGKELVQRDANGRPVMSVVTEREDGTDAMVFAPTAVAKVRHD